MDSDSAIFLRALIWLGLTFLTAKIAFERGRSVVTWTIFGLIAPVLSLICALCLSKNPPKEAEDAHSFTALSLSAPTEQPKKSDKQGAA
jgi:hypothetical protein